jgi:P2 family phage contractile tail tube protein
MCYLEGNELLGVTDVTLPEIAYMTDTIKGAGIAGEIDTLAIGHTQSMSTTINWRSLFEDNANMFAPKPYHFDFRGSVQMTDEESGRILSKAVKVVMKCLPKTGTLGNFDVATQMGTSGEYEVTYLKITIEGRDLIEIDKLNFIFVVDGVDYLAKVRKDIGRG